MTSSTALITGGLGFIGSYIARQLIEEDRVDKVVCLDHYGRYTSSTRPEFIDYRRLRIADIGDRLIIERGEAKYFSVLLKVIQKYTPKYIFHLAALPLAKLENLNAEEALEGTVHSTTHLLELIGLSTSYFPMRFVYASSSMVYGDFTSDPVTEESPTFPKEIYGTMKLAGEVITKGLCNHYGISYTIVRPSAVFGPTDMNRRVSQIFLEEAIMEREITINGADEKLDFTYVKDVANGFVLAAISEKSDHEIFNITHGKAHTLLDYMKCLKRHFPNIKYRITERDTFRPKRGTLSIEKATRLLGYVPKYSLQQAVDDYVAFVRLNHPNLKAESGK